MHLPSIGKQSNMIEQIKNIFYKWQTFAFHISSFSFIAYNLTLRLYMDTRHCQPNFDTIIDVYVFICQSLNRVKCSLNIQTHVLSWVYRALLYHFVIYFAFIFVLCRWCIMFCSYIFKFVFVCDNTIRFPLYVYKWQWHIVCRLDRINKVEEKLRKVRGCTRLCTV